jgi:DNA-3-methyladenine glycosylase II
MPCTAAYKALQKAAKPYPALADCLKTHGPLWFPERNHEGSDLHLARAIVGQQLSTKAARAIWNKVAALAESRNMTVMQLCDEKYREDLRGCGVSYSKIRAMCAIHDHYRQHGLNDDVLRAMPHADRSKNLVQIWGVGEWTVDMLSLFYFEDPDVWAIKDGGLQRAMVRIKRTPLTLKEMEKAGDDFRPWRSIASLYLWRLLDTPDIL